MFDSLIRRRHGVLHVHVSQIAQHGLQRLPPAPLPDGFGADAGASSSWRRSAGIHGDRFHHAELAHITLEALEAKRFLDPSASPSVEDVLADSLHPQHFL